MRSVPSRTTRRNFGATDATIIRGGEITDLIEKAQSYAEIVAGAKKVLDLAEMELRDAGTPSEAALKALASAREKLRKWDTVGMVSFSTLLGITTSDGTGDFLGTAYGAKTPIAKDVNVALGSRIEEVGRNIEIFAPGTTAAGPNWSRRNAPVAANESFFDAYRRWAAEDSARRTSVSPGTVAPTPSSSAPPALTMSIPTSNYPSGTTTAQAGPSGASVSMQDGAATGGQPAWLLPALVGTAVAGVALLLLPDGSGNRGSRARNLDYGRVTSDAQEGRMLRNTLRNLETDAHAMRQMLRDDDDLPQWVHAKVQTSADRVNAAHRYLRAKIQGS